MFFLPGCFYQVFWGWSPAGFRAFEAALPAPYPPSKADPKLGKQPLLDDGFEWKIGNWCNKNAKKYSWITESSKDDYHSAWWNIIIHHPERAMDLQCIVSLRYLICKNMVQRRNDEMKKVTAPKLLFWTLKRMLQWSSIARMVLLVKPFLLWCFCVRRME